MNSTPLHECLILVHRLLARRGVSADIAREVESLLTERLEGSTDVPVAAPAQTLDTPLLSAERYRQGVERGRGGMGSVYRVEDRWLDRELVCKVQHEGADARRFLEEARVTAQLQHPNILPVHELGRLSHGRLGYTMREVHGHTLEEVLGQLHGQGAGWERAQWTDTSTGTRWTFRRALDALRQVCEAVAYAHSRRIVHRDIKPSNIMVGGFGEVYLVDWGLARAVGAIDAALGTPPYMAPEPLGRGATAVGTAADVYALGASLYHVLAGHPPYLGEDPLAVQAAVRAGPPAPLPRGDRPEELVALCESAMARDPAARLPSARALAQGLLAWLDGEQLRDHALAALREAEDLRAEAEAHEHRAQDAAERAAKRLDGVPAWAPEAEKHAGWEAEEEQLAERLAAERASTRMLQRVQSALILAPRLPEALDALATHHHARHVAAEAAGDRVEATRHEALLAIYDAGRYASYLRNRGRLTLRASPEGTTVQLYRFEARHRRLHPVPVGAPRPCPLLDLELAGGSYLARLTAPGCDPVDYPFVIRREARWETARPIVLPMAGTLRTDERLVPGGWFTSGGGAVADDPLPQAERWSDAFVIRADPVQNAEYLVFLNDLMSQGRAAEARASVPQERGANVGELGPPIYGQGPDGTWFLTRDRDGQLWAPDLPVVNITWFAAVNFCAWLAARDGRPWRLPTELEWEKAARGVDGRTYPWGDGFDPSFCCMRHSHRSAEEAMPSPVGPNRFPADTSPYGVRGMAGNVGDWCADPWQPPGAAADTSSVPERQIRGGHWYAMPRGLTWRQSLNPLEVLPTVGLRPVYTPAEGL